MKRSVLIVLLIVILVIILSSIYFKLPKNDSFPDDLYCESDADCFPASCCHANSCVGVANKPDCSANLCSAVCELGTLDCGQASCLCVKNKCNFVLK